MSHAAQMKRMGRACSAPCRFIVWAIRRSRTHEMKREARNRGRHGGSGREAALTRWSAKRVIEGGMADSMQIGEYYE